MNNEKVINTLNKLLQGQYMGIHAYENFIKNLDNSSSLLTHFMTIQKDLKHYAELLSGRIRELQGVPETSEGIIGKVELFIGQIFDHPHEEKDIL
ncbi:DUF2383 domain-containing protein, partial [Priestia megaterium]